MSVVNHRQDSLAAEVVTNEIIETYRIDIGTEFSSGASS